MRVITDWLIPSFMFNIIKEKIQDLDKVQILSSLDLEGLSTSLPLLDLTPNFITRLFNLF